MDNHTVHAQYRCKYTSTHTCRIWKQTHIRTTITQSHKQVQSPNKPHSEKFVNRFQGSVMYFLFLCRGFTIEKKKKNHLCVHAVFLLWRGAGSFKADDMQRLRWVLTAHGCDSTGRHHGNPVYHPQLPHLLSLVLSPNAANNPGSLRHLRDQSSSLSG